MAKKREVIFKLEPEKTPEALFPALCVGVKNYYQEKRKIYLHMPSDKLAEKMDEFLWNFDDESFIPHDLTSERLRTPPPVQIGTSPSFSHQDILINLTDRFENFFMRFQTIIEWVPSNENALKKARARYREYQKHALTPITHDNRSETCSYDT